MEKEKSEDEAISCISKLMRYTDENHVITGEDICSAMADIYGIEAERRGIYRDIDEIKLFLLLRKKFQWKKQKK